ncbi:MAG: isoprenylcysteine carboxylmethyltransferase family protein [Acidimicrobiales bacterium]
MADDSTSDEREATHQAIYGWLFVGVQAALLGILVFWSPQPTWTFPDWVDTAGFALGLLGLIWLLVGALNLGRSLTATPVPRSEGSLKTGGLYRLSRHPIYTGVLALAFSSAIRRANWMLVVVAVGLYVLFEFKARFEERLLTKAYPGYAHYAARVPRFVPVGRRLF